jgi:transmembrane sensor
LPKIDFDSLRERTVTLDEGRAAAISAAVLRRRDRHTARGRIAGGVGAALTLGILIAFVLALSGRRAPPVATHGTLPSKPPDLLAEIPRAPLGFGGIVLADGSRVTFLEPGTELAQAGTTGRQSTLVHGGARFDVVHGSIPFRVTAGNVVVEDIGTVFTIHLTADGHTTVDVESGSVSVRGADGEIRLGASDSETFPNPSRARPAAPEPSEPSAEARGLPRPPAPARPSWQALARAGDYEQAYAMIESGAEVVGDDPDELWLASDSARLTGHPARAVPLLRRTLERFPTDSRAGMAALTLGRVLLDDLGQPREAAEVFATAHAHGGPLAEDALAREVEAWTRAGDRGEAKAAAARYLAAYPSGRQAAYVQRLVGDP